MHTLVRTLEKSLRYKPAFRAAGGFAVCLQILDAIAHVQAQVADAVVVPADAATVEHTSVELVLAILKGINCALTHCAENQVDFEQEGRFAAILPALSAPFLLAPDRALAISEHLISIGVRERWPFFPAVQSIRAADIPSALRLRSVP